MSDRPRIAYVLKRFPRFSETFILNELLAHEAAGAEVHVFSLLSPPDEPHHARLAELKAKVMVLKAVKGQPVEANRDARALFSGKTSVEIGNLQAKAAFVANRCADMGITHLHAHFGSDAATVACLAARALNGTYSYTAHARDIYHTYVSPEADTEMRRAKLSASTFTVTVSDYNARYLSSLCPNARIERLYNGIDLSAFRPVDPAGQNPGQLIAVGRHVPKKGFDVLIDACALLRDRGVQFDLALIGSGPMEEELAAQIARQALGDCVHLEGPRPQEDLIERMGQAEAAVLPCVVTESGDRDGLPTVLLEAMARALPVVTTTVSGGPEIVEDGVTGHLCAPGDPAALADALESVLSNRDAARAMGIAGRARAEKLFDLTTNAGRLRAMLLDPLAVREAA